MPKGVPSSNKLSGFGGQRVSGGFIALLAASIQTNYDRTLDKPDSDGLQAIKVTASVGNGRGSTKLDIPGNQLAEVIDVLEAFDPEAVEQVAIDLPMAEVIKRTLTVDRAEVPEGSPEGTVGEVISYTFKTSFAKHTREVTVPVEDWQKFINVFRDRLDPDSPLSVYEAVPYYREAAAEMDKQAAEKAAKKAAAGVQVAPVHNPLAQSNVTAAPETPSDS